MRTIKFRGKRVDNGEWVYGYYINQYGAHSIYLPDGADGIFDAYHVVPETVGQFTGFYDEVGAEIYDRDIFTTRNGYNYFVVFENGSFECYHCNHRDTVNGGMLLWGLLSRAYELVSEFTPKKIGNIHDNPELLK
jgi:uncharacterized phage protein (TIGR01671 family)